MHPFSQFKYCPKCGSDEFVEHNFKSKVCKACGFVYYFNSSASTAAFIFNANNELLTVRRAKDPAKGTLDLPGGFVDMYETAEEAIIREIREETGLTATHPKFLFTLPNVYVYSEFEVHTVDLFFTCQVTDFSQLNAADDAAEIVFVPEKDIQPKHFGLDSIRKAVEWKFGESKKELASAVTLMSEEYRNDKELTAFTQLIAANDKQALYSPFK